MESREDLIYRARLAEQGERYKDMIEAMKSVAQVSNLRIHPTRKIEGQWQTKNDFLTGLFINSKAYSIAKKEISYQQPIKIKWAPAVLLGEPFLQSKTRRNIKDPSIWN